MPHLATTRPPMGVMIPWDIFIIFNRLNADRAALSQHSITIRFHDTPVTFVALLTIVAIINIVRLLEIRTETMRKTIYQIKNKTSLSFPKSVILPAKNEKMRRIKPLL